MQSLDKTVDSSASNMTPHSPSEYLFAGFCSFSRGVVPLALSETPPSSASKAFFQQRLLWSSIIKPLFDTSSTLQFIILFLGALLILSSIVLWKVFRERHTSTGEKTSSDLQCLRALKDQHETALALIDLVDEDGAGAWPPRADHNSWPLAIRPYKDIYLELVSLLPTAEPSLDDAVNNERIQTYRLLMRTKLAQRIDIAQVVEILANVEAGNQEVLPRAAYNGMYCCVAVCRHAYRYFC